MRRCEHHILRHSVKRCTSVKRKSKARQTIAIRTSADIYDPSVVNRRCGYPVAILILNLKAHLIRDLQKLEYVINQLARKEDSEERRSGRLTKVRKSGSKWGATPLSEEEPGIMSGYFAIFPRAHGLIVSFRKGSSASGGSPTDSTIKSRNSVLSLSIERPYSSMTALKLGISSSSGH